MRAIALLARHGFEFNILATVHAANEASPLEAPEGGPDLNDLCEGYRAFFRHVDEPTRRLAAFLPPTPGAKIGVNTPCPGGSGLKFKRCHGASKSDERVYFNPLPEQPTHSRGTRLR
jgi:hypothetical protein